MLLFIPSTVAFYLGGTLYETFKELPFLALMAGMVLAAVWSILRVRDPEKLEH